MVDVPTRRAGGLDAVCVGESMAMITPVDARRLAERPALTLDVGGAESNVACGLAALGHRTAWLSRVGADPFGEQIVHSVAARGVDVSAVETDPVRRTGVYFKDPGPAGTRVYYYRAGSAASAMGPATRRWPGLRECRLVHLSGITPALSPSCAELVDDLVVRRRAGAPLVSFDVNYRPGLWPVAEAAPVLRRLARAADIVFVGRDEAETLWQAGTPDAIRGLLDSVPLLVVKDAARAAWSFGDGGTVVVPARRVAVVEPVGAGDAFAAGFLSALLDGRPPQTRLRMGHLLAAEALRCTVDVPIPPDRAELDRYLDLDADSWAEGANVG